MSTKKEMRYDIHECIRYIRNNVSASLFKEIEERIELYKEMGKEYDITWESYRDVLQGLKKIKYAFKDLVKEWNSERGRY